MICRKPYIRPAMYDRKRVALLQASALYRVAYEKMIEGTGGPDVTESVLVFEERMLRAALEFSEVARDTESPRGETIQ